MCVYGSGQLSVFTCISCRFTRRTTRGRVTACKASFLLSAKSGGKAGYLNTLASHPDHFSDLSGKKPSEGHLFVIISLEISAIKAQHHPAVKSVAESTVVQSRFEIYWIKICCWENRSPALLCKQISYFLYCWVSQNTQLLRFTKQQTTYMTLHNVATSWLGNKAESVFCIYYVASRLCAQLQTTTVFSMTIERQLQPASWNERMS